MERDIKLKMNLKPTESDVAVIFNGLCDYNDSFFPDVKESTLVLSLDNTAGNIEGGIAAKIVGSVLHIDYFWIPKKLRRQHLGSRLMDRMESFALSHQLTSICLDTYTFQAPLFYQDLGFVEVGRFVNFPVAGVDKLFFQKVLVD